MNRAALALVILLAVGCHHAGTAPQGWRGVAFSPGAVVNKGNPAQPASVNETNEPHGTLQVLICYGKVLSNHTALRLVTPGEQTIFWDPGGTFLQHDPTRARRHDVLTQNAPDLMEWWHYRRDGCREPILEVYEWSLHTDQARRLHGVLLNHRDPENTDQIFEPDAGGLQCCTRVSGFLMRFAGGRPNVNKAYFWPHKLGEHLWSQHPDRVWVFHAQGEHQVYHYEVDSAVTK